MPYSKTRKIVSRQKILESAYKLFSSRSYEEVTIDTVMENCGMTRGGFYAHFQNKTELYRYAIEYAFANSKLASSECNTWRNEREHLTDILDGYLSLEHVNGNNPCPLAFLTSDIALRDSETRQIFADAYSAVNKKVWAYAKTFSQINESDIAPLTAMVVGTVALTRSITDEITVENMLKSTRRHVEIHLGITFDTKSLT